MMCVFKNAEEIISKFVSSEEDKQSDYLKRENSNFVYSLSLLRKNLANKAENDFLLEHIMPPQLVEAFNEGIVYIHDRQLQPYCMSLSIKQVAMEGVPTRAKNMIPSAPTKRLRKLLRHISNAVVLLSQQVSGAIMGAQMTSVLAAYLKYEEEERGFIWTEEELKEEMQSLIWELNMPLRSGSESSFTNISMEFGRPSPEIEEHMVVIGGIFLNYKYKDIEPVYFDRINKAIIDVMFQGTGTAIPFTFPLISIQIDDDFNFDNPMFHYFLKKFYAWNGCYFENFRKDPFEDSYYKSLNPYLQSKDPSVSRSLCCRLQIDLTALSNTAGGGIFGSSIGSVGALQVIDVNMNRLLMQYGSNKEELFKQIRYYFELAQQGHIAKRKFIEANMDLYPTFFSYNKDLKNYFHVFSPVGIHEGLINAGFSEGIKDSEGKGFGHEILQYIRKLLNEFIERDGYPCGLEASPNENAAIKLARHDVKWARLNNKECFVQGQGDDIFMTSGAMLPFSEENYLDLVENAAEFQGYFTSGSINHHFLEEELTPEKIIALIDRLFTKPINYITVTPTTSGCMDCGQKFYAKDGIELETCPTCGSDDLITVSRVIGYAKAISRKSLKKNKDNKYEGEYNFWSNARRIDWASRTRVTSKNLGLED